MSKLYILFILYERELELLININEYFKKQTKWVIEKVKYSRKSEKYKGEDKWIVLKNSGKWYKAVCLWDTQESNILHGMEHRIFGINIKGNR